MSDDMKERLLARPFCGSADIDYAFWMRGHEACGPGCSDCGATADTVEAWNMRASTARIAELEAQLKAAREVLEEARVCLADDCLPWLRYSSPREGIARGLIEDVVKQIVAHLDPKPTATGETP